MSNGTRARHRAVRAKPFSGLAQSLTSEVGKRAAAVAAASGLALTVLVPATAQAAPSGQSDAPTEDDGALSALASEARAALSQAPSVTVAAGARVQGETVVTISVTPAPEPVAPPPPPVAPASRAEVRPAPVAVAAPPSAAGSAVAEIALRYQGVPYVTGGATPDGFDCSGFVMFVYAQLGIALPHQTESYPGVGTQVSAADAQVGDIIYSPGHVGIYLGDGLQIDAPRPGKSVQVRGIWQTNPMFIRVA
jgi:cell wall-associated NlpC family hydrolase